MLKKVFIVFLTVLLLVINFGLVNVNYLTRKDIHRNYRSLFSNLSIAIEIHKNVFNESKNPRQKTRLLMRERDGVPYLLEQFCFQYMIDDCKEDFT